MLHSRYIVVEDFPDDSSRVVYNGPSSIEAQKAMGQSIDEGKAQAVLFIAHPLASQVRYPLQEALDAAERVRLAEKARTTALDANKALAEHKRKQAKELQEQAAALEAQAVAHESGEGEEPEEQESEEPAEKPAKQPAEKPAKQTKKKSNE